MPAKIEVHAREENSYTVVCTFTDEDDSGCVPNTLTWTLTDMDGNVLNGRDAVSVSPSATAENILLAPTDTTIISGQNNKRLFLVEWTYDSDYGTGLYGKEQAIFVIDDLRHIT